MASFWINLRRFFLGPEKFKTLNELREYAAGDPWKLAEYARYHWGNVSIGVDKENWQHPEDAFNEFSHYQPIHDSLNCDDYAVIYDYCLDGYKTKHLIYIVSKIGAHAICVFADGNEWRYLSNQRVMPYRFKTIADICRDVYSHPTMAFFKVWNGKKYVFGEKIDL